MLMSASPGRGGDGAGADRAQRATGSSTTDRKICSTVSGDLMSSSLSRFSGWRSRSLSLGEGLTDSTARGMAPALMVGWIEGGAGFFLFSVLPGAAVELPGRSRPAPGGVDLRRGGSMSSSLSRFSGWHCERRRFSLRRPLRRPCCVEQRSPSVGVVVHAQRPLMVPLASRPDHAPPGPDRQCRAGCGIRSP